MMESEKYKLKKNNMAKTSYLNVSLKLVVSYTNIRIVKLVFVVIYSFVKKFPLTGFGLESLSHPMTFWPQI